jgi:hypothetical protein
MTTTTDPHPQARLRPEDTGGAAANLSGKATRARVEALLRTCVGNQLRPGISVRKDVHLGSGPYGQPAVADFVIDGAPVRRLSSRIWDRPGSMASVGPEDGVALVVVAQHARGSGDQKLPFLVLTCLSMRLPAIIIYDGDGFQRGAIRWLRGGCVGVVPTQLRDWPTPLAMRVDELETWAARRLRG